jgi:hypothetical protein
VSVIDPTRTNRQPQVIGAKPAENVVFRVYHPPIPSEGTGVLEAADGSKATYRDFRITKCELWQDGSMVLHALTKLGEVPDVRPEARLGDKIESWMETIAAVVDPEGHIRGESIVLGPEAPEQAAVAIN